MEIHMAFGSLKDLYQQICDRDLFVLDGSKVSFLLVNIKHCKHALDS